MALYVDSSASSSQRRALTEAYHGIHGGHLGVVASLAKGAEGGPENSYRLGQQEFLTS